MSMKRSCIAIIALALVLAGCHKNDVTVTTPDGTTISSNGTSTTIKDDKGNVASVNSSADGTKTTVNDGKGGTATFGTGQVSEADLGLPFYAGSQDKQGGSSTVDAPDGKAVTSIRTTKDDPQQVADFYKDKVKDPQASNVNSSGNKLSSIVGKLGDSADVVITASKNGTEDTTISIIVSHKKK